MPLAEQDQVQPLIMENVQGVHQQPGSDHRMIQRMNRNRLCYNCRKPGHFAADYSHLNNQKQTRLMQNIIRGLKDLHMVLAKGMYQDCKNRRKRKREARAPGQLSKDRKCYNCQEPGHEASVCPYQTCLKEQTSLDIPNKTSLNSLEKVESGDLYSTKEQEEISLNILDKTSINA